MPFVDSRKIKLAIEVFGSNFKSYSSIILFLFKKEEHAKSDIYMLKLMIGQLKYATQNSSSY